ncbi:MAG: ImmA/IrrE family metallo-endopeptidase [Sulfurimonas sp.]|jgi:Zn-dependent peptidase ImmA (M78 family)
MNTVKIGDKFEDKSYDLIEKAINNNEFGISKESAKVFKKKGYYSRDREKDIIFDLSIEIWPKNAKRYSLLFLIECKSSLSKKVPVDDVEEFYTKINQVAGVNVKGVMISDKSFQSGGLTFAKNRGMMLIEVDSYDTYSIILHKTDHEKIDEKNKEIDEIFFYFIKKTLGIEEVNGLKKLSSEQIENIAKQILEKYNKLITGINISEFISHLENEYNLTFDFSKELETVNGKKIKGYCDLRNKKILLDYSIVNTEEFSFILGHELGHYFLHQNLKINQEQYNDFEDSKYDFLVGKYALKNDRNWIEWQANKFSVSLFMPKELFLTRLITYRKGIGISRPEHIYLDNQSINKQDYYKTLNYLSNYFGTSKTSVKYMIEELNLITDTTYNYKTSICKTIFKQIPD